MIPAHKSDLEAADRVIEAGMPAVEPILGEILEWFQDYNWPVARRMVSLFDDLGPEVVPHIKSILSCDDDVWKYWVVSILIPRLAPSAKEMLRTDLQRIAEKPTSGEVEEEVNLEAIDCLKEMS